MLESVKLGLAKVGAFVKKAKNKVAAFVAGGFAIIAGSTPANAAITFPTPDYTDFEAGVALVIGVVLTVMLAKKVKGFFR